VATLYLNFRVKEQQWSDPDHPKVFSVNFIRMMKLYLTLLAGLFFSQLFSQQDSSIIKERVRKNVIRVNLTSSYFSTIGLGYERVFKDRWSANLTVSLKPKTELGSLFNFSGNGISFEGKPSISGFYLTPEVRWYADGNDVRKAPRGFYMGPYIRYSETYLKTHIHYTDEENDLNADFKFTFREVGLGINFGYQLLAIKERLVIDFLFAGPRVSRYTLISEASTDLNGDFYRQLAENINDKLGFEFLDPNLEFKNEKKQKVESTTLGYRYSIRIGYAF